MYDIEDYCLRWITSGAYRNRRFHASVAANTNWEHVKEKPEIVKEIK